MTHKQARQLFDRTCQRLHEAGWDVLAIISKTEPGATETSQRLLIQHGDGGQTFFRLHRALRGPDGDRSVPQGFEPAVGCGTRPNGENQGA